MSSGSDSDEDFVPGEPEQLSEEESADDETDLQYEKEQEHKARKRKATEEATAKKKRKTKKSVKEVEEVKPPVEEEVVPETLSPEDEKKKADDLWAKFLEGTETKPKPKVSAITEAPKPTVSNNNKPQASDVKQNKEDDKARERRIFEFAGETIVVENNIIKEKIKTADTPAAVKLGGPSRSRGGGLSNVLGQLNQKSKLSTLEKSKLDWATYKQEEGIEEEIQSHNKGKHGYLERQDFLERADLRQYEIERDLRLSRRSNR